MRYSFVSAVVIALASSVAGQIFDDITSPTFDQVIPAGEPFDIIWVPAGVDGTITITLLQGPTNISLATGPVIKSGVNNLDGHLTWTSADGSFATYGFFFQHEQKKELTEYSRPFHIKGGKAVSGSSSAGGSTTTIQLSTGPSYAAFTSTTTSSVPSSTVTVVSTSTSPITSSTVVVPHPSSASSNVTIATLTSTSTAAGNGSSPATSTPSASSPVVVPNAATNVASGGLAIVGGLILAFLL